jgi:cytoskeletal protein CcmA (bactofilin family)
MAGPQTIIGSSIIITGELKSGEDVAILGKVEGRIETTADLFVQDGGTIEAEVSTRNIEVRGTLKGDIVASDRFEILPGGTVDGDVHAPRVVLADGARYRGHIAMTGPSDGPPVPLKRPRR